MFKHAVDARYASEDKLATFHKIAVEQVRVIIDEAIEKGETKTSRYLNMSADDGEYCLRMLRANGYGGKITHDQRDGSGFTFHIDWSKAE